MRPNCQPVEKSYEAKTVHKKVHCPSQRNPKKSILFSFIFSVQFFIVKKLYRKILDPKTVPIILLISNPKKFFAPTCRWMYLGTSV